MRKSNLLITPFNNMLLINNLRIQCLDWDYPVESSSLPADLLWIGFELESAPWKMLYLVCKTCKTLYNKYKFFPVQFAINQATNDTKIKLADNMWESLLRSTSKFSPLRKSWISISIIDSAVVAGSLSVGCKLLIYF